MSISESSPVVRDISTAPSNRTLPKPPTTVELTIEDCDHGYHLTAQLPQFLCYDRVTFIKGWPTENGRHLLPWSRTRGLGLELSAIRGVKRVAIQNGTVELWVKHSWQLARVEEKAVEAIARNRKWEPKNILVHTYDYHTVTIYERKLHYDTRHAHPQITFAVMPIGATGVEA